MAQKIFLIALLALVLSSCGPKVQTLEVFSKPVEVAVTPPPKPAPIHLQDIKWKVLTVDNSVYYGLTVKDYQKLSGNVLEIKKFLVAQANIIKYYESVTGSEDLTHEDTTVSSN